MLPDRVSNPGPLIYESGALPIALRGSARLFCLLISRLHPNPLADTLSCTCVIGSLHKSNFSSK